jgi:hypothetical protein
VPVVVGRLADLLDRPRDKQHDARHHATAYKLLAIISLIALVLQSSLIFICLFEPPLPYEIADPGSEPLDSPEFVRVLAAVTGGWLSDGNAVEVRLVIDAVGSTAYVTTDSPRCARQAAGSLGSPRALVYVAARKQPDTSN